MNRLQAVAMVIAALSVMALLIVTASHERQTRLMLYCVAAALLAAGGCFILLTQEWHNEHWGYFNPVAGFYFLALAVAPVWAAINLIRHKT